MDLEANIEALEHRYQELYDQYQAGKISDATFIAEVDKLQLQDNYGRYWMIGAQTGSWHYYDGQAWHQAEPREADSLPFMDGQGRYWQRGVKSGDWYYHQAETGEWVKPGPGEEPVLPDAGYQQPGYGNYQSRLQPQSTDAGPGMPSQLDGELFQDDDGRYWAVGSKSGQWYFYDYDGWHPAHEFQQTVKLHNPPPGQPYVPAGYQSSPPQTSYQTYQGYEAQSYQPQDPQGYPSQSQPQQPQNYQPGPGSQSPAPGSHGVSGQDAQTGGQPQPQPGPRSQQPDRAATPPAGHEVHGPKPSTVDGQSEAEGQIAGQMPPPPQGDAGAGAWYYFDGQQWLRYASDEPEEAPSPPPKMVIDQEASPSDQVKVESDDEPVVAEVFEEDEPPVEVVDVEVITVVEAEPDEEPEPLRDEEPSQAPEPRTPPSTYPSPSSDEVIPRRTARSSQPSRPSSDPVKPQRQPRERTSTDPLRPAAPRKKETAHEPTIIIPTGATASKISSPTPTPRPKRDTRPVTPAVSRQRRARENTLPMEKMGEREGTSAPTPTPKRRSVTQPMPATAAPAQQAGTVQMGAPTPARQTTGQTDQASPAPATQSAGAQTEQSGYTFGDVLRSLPSTLWTFVGGVILLLACAVGVIFSSSWLQGSDLGAGNIAAIESPTPTLAAGPPDATPTPGPTPTVPPEPDVTPESVEVTTFSSPALGITLEYPEDWEQEDTQQLAIFSPSEAGLDPENMEDAAFWIGTPENERATIAELLTEVLAAFPADASTLNEGTISIASQTWTSAQISFDDEDLGGEGIATLAVTNKDGVGYYLVAVAPAADWNLIQPQFQEMINSFRFATEDVIAQAASEEEDSEEEDESGTTTPEAGTGAEESLEATPVPDVSATPVTYVIKSGDTLLEIAQQFGVDVDLLASENNIDSPEGLQVGQELTIPFTAEQLAAYNASGNAPVAEASGAGDETGEADEIEAAGAAESDEGASSEEAAAPAEPQAEASQPAALSGKIAYPAFDPGTNNYSLWLVDVASGEQSVISGEASQPAFNRDGSLLAYRSWGLGTRGIFFRDFVGGRGGQVTRFVEDGLPTWAPDGFSFAFASRKEGDRVPRIYIGNQLGEETFSVGFQGEYPSTFPDGRLVVKGCLPSGDCGLFVMGPTGGGERKIAGPEDTAPAVSPDGSKIAIMSAGRGATNWEIWTINADGSGPQRLTDNGSNEGLPAWSPDGQSIAYASDQGGVWAIWVMNADGSNQRKLFNMMGSPDGIVLHSKDNSKGWLEERITWAP